MVAGTWCLAPGLWIMGYLSLGQKRNGEWLQGIHPPFPVDYMPFMHFYLCSSNLQMPCATGLQNFLLPCAARPGGHNIFYSDGRHLPDSQAVPVNKAHFSYSTFELLPRKPIAGPCPGSF